MDKVHYSSATDEWSTPQEFFDKINAIYNFTLDVCATPENAKCERFFTKEQNGLVQDWFRVACANPLCCNPHNDYKTMHEVQEVEGCKHADVSAKRSDDIKAEQLVQGLLQGEGKKHDAIAASGPEGEHKSEGSEGSPSEKREGPRVETIHISSSESQKATKGRNEMDVVTPVVGANEGGVRPQVRVLRKGRKDSSSRSLFTPQLSSLPWNSSVEHSAGLQAMLAAKGEIPALELVQGQRAACRHCGEVGVVSHSRCYMNSPYGRVIGDWILKAYEESLRGALVVCLVPARTDTAWWHDYVSKGQVHFIRGRLKFGGGKNSAPFPSALVVFTPFIRNADKVTITTLEKFVALANQGRL